VNTCAAWWASGWHRAYMLHKPCATPVDRRRLPIAAIAAMLAGDRYERLYEREMRAEAGNGTKGGAQ
jgi:hypothetical protein